MENLVISFFGQSNQQEYLDTILVFIEITATMLSLLTIFFSINFENKVLKSREIIWNLKNEEDIKKTRKLLNDYSTIEEINFNYYDNVIKKFRIINIILIIAILVLSIIKMYTIENSGGISFLWAMSLVLISTIIIIIDSFKTSKEDKSIINYNDIINMENFDKYFNENLKMEVQIEVFISQMNGEMQIRYTYPFETYNLNVGFCVDNKVFYSFKSQNDKIHNYEVKNVEANQHLYTLLKDREQIEINVLMIVGKQKKYFNVKCSIDNRERGIYIKSKEYIKSEDEVNVLERNMKRDGIKFIS